MVKKVLGYVELEWTCPQCGSRNPGTHKQCSSCGKAQPKRVAFHQAAEEELISDKAEIARAKSGADVHCAFCGARNPTGAERCTQCGADLGAATARESGRVLGAHRRGPAAPVRCPSCGAENDANALKCAQCNARLPKAAPDRPRPATPARPTKARAAKKPGRKLGLAAILGIGAVALFAVVVCVLIVLSLIPSKELTGVVQSVRWERAIEIEALQDVTKEDWRDRIPAGARVGNCTQKHRRTQDSPAANATEVCGTPYTVDTGTGHGEVVQDCEYRVYDEWCTYGAQEWKKVAPITANGTDLSPRWPEPRLTVNERERDREETFKVVFETETKTYTYTTSDVDRFRQCRIGSRWVLKINALGGVKSIQPAE